MWNGTPMRVASLLPSLTLAACTKGPEVAHPFNGQTRYLCCNLYYDKDGTGGSAQVKIATIVNKTTLKFDDFFVI